MSIATTSCFIPFSSQQKQLHTLGLKMGGERINRGEEGYQRIKLNKQQWLPLSFYLFLCVCVSIILDFYSFIAFCPQCILLCCTCLLSASLSSCLKSNGDSATCLSRLLPFTFTLISIPTSVPARLSRSACTSLYKHTYVLTVTYLLSCISLVALAPSSLTSAILHRSFFFLSCCTDSSLPSQSTLSLCHPSALIGRRQDDLD